MSEEKKAFIKETLQLFIEKFGKEVVIRRLNGFIMTSDPVYLPVEYDIRVKLGRTNTQELLDIIIEEYVN